MLECNKCSKILQFSKFGVDRKSKRGFNATCKDCLRLARNAKKDQVSKDEAKEFMLELEKQGKEYTCATCQQTMTVDKFYYKRDYGKVYVNTTGCKKCTTNRQRERAFGITWEQFEVMLANQDNKCSICLVDHDEYKARSQNNKVFSVDHDHRNGRIRGLLCDVCNRGLGYLKDDVDVLKRAITYLEKEGDDIV